MKKIEFYLKKEQIIKDGTISSKAKKLKYGKNKVEEILEK